MVHMWKRPGMALACAALVALPPAQGQVYGSLANFDAVNDTGYRAHGFEIDIEDSSFHRSSIYSVFGLDRNFGVPPTSVVRYGAPTIEEIAGYGVRIRYQASFANGAWSVGTPTGPYPGAGDSCWPLGNPQYNSGNLTCDHFGVATYGSPAKTHYRWLVDTGGNSGVLTPVVAGIPPVNFVYVAPDPQVNRPVQVEAEIDAPDNPDDPNNPIGQPYWVKIFAHRVDHNVEVQNLMQGHPDVPGDDDAVEVEYAIFQSGDNEGDLSRKINRFSLNEGDAALVLRYEFYKYVGPLKADGSIDCSGKGGAPHGVDDCGGLGDYAGAQMAGFNLVQPALPAVPEPGTWAMLAAGLGLVLRRIRRSR